MRRISVFICLLIIFPFAGSPLPETAIMRGMLQTQNKPGIPSITGEIFRKFLNSHKVLTVKDNEDVIMVNRVSTQLFNAVKKYSQTKKSFNELNGNSWEIHLVQEEKADAWCLPGGKMVVYSSLLPVTQNGASLTVLLSHELAHIFLKHGEARMKQYLKDYLDCKDLETAIASKPDETKDFLKMAFGTGNHVGMFRGFSEDDEIEADKLGLIFYALAGYHPSTAIVFWERMYKLKGTARQPELVSTHPVNEKRMIHLEEIVDDITKKY